MPMATLHAFADHGRVHGPTAEHDPTADLDALREAGIDMKQVTDELLIDGIQQFEDAMNRLLAGIDEHRAAVLTGRPKTIEGKIPEPLQGPIAERINQAMKESVAQRVWRRDPSLWGGPGV